MDTKMFLAVKLDVDHFDELEMKRVKTCLFFLYNNLYG